MSLFVKRLCTTLSLCVALIVPAFAATTVKTNPQISVRPKARITEAVDAKKVDLLPGTHSARVNSLADGGRVAKNTPLQHLKLVLKSSDEQEFALRQLLDQQQDKSHGNYHQWMTPETFGTTFGVESSDIEKVKNWLTSNGLTVDAVAKGARVITFSGASGDIETAFHTEMHNYIVDGKPVISANSDVSIPHALTSVVIGPAKMDNIHPHPHYTGGRKILFDHGKAVSSTPVGGGTPNYLDPLYGQLVGAQDLQLIYDAKPMYAQGIHGEGMTVGIIAETDTLLADTQIYRSVFGLPPTTINVIHAGDDPGNQTAAGDDVESDIDLQMGGALAYNANIDFIVGGITFFGDGVNTAALYAADNNIGDVISMSYGLCEADDTTDIPLFGSVWEQAASQGQTVFVSSGDSGPDTCAGDEGTLSAANGYSVTGWGETPYNVSVGGTEFNEALAPTVNFWSPDQSLVTGYENALAYPPEVPWNLSQFGDGLAPSTQGYGPNAGSSGISFYYLLPSWQVGPGVPTTDPQPPTGEGTIKSTSYKVAGAAHRYVPDISANASNGYDSTAVCSEGACQVNSDGTLASVTAFGGTSVSSPLMASAQALIDQANGGRQGNANYYYYRVAAAQPVAGCSSTTYLTTATAACGFHDVVDGSDLEPTNTAGTSSLGWNVTPSFDLAIGLGSPDIAQLSALWKTVTFNATTTTMTLSPTTSSTHGQAYNLSVAVAPASGTAQPTGQVAIVAETGTFVSTYVTLANGAYTSAAFKGLPAGTYQVYAQYFGDGTFGGSTSAPVTVTVGTETPTIPLVSYSISTAAAMTATSNFTYGSSIYLQSGANPPSKVGVPTGTITFNLALQGGAALKSLTEALEPDNVQDGNTLGTTTYAADASLITGNATPEYLITPNYPELAPGTYTATATYSGDSTFNSGTSSTITFVVGKGTPTITLSPVTASDIAAGTPVILGASIATLAAVDNGIAPTGTVTFVDTTNGNLPLGSGTLTAVTGGASSVMSVSTSLIVTPGAHTITATYSGDSLYSAGTATTVLTVGGAAEVLVLTTTTPLVGQVLDPFSFTATLPTGTATGRTKVGTIVLYDGGIQIGTAALTGAYTTTFVPVLTAGVHKLVAEYSGNTALAVDAATSNTVTVTVNPNTPVLQLSVAGNASIGNSAGVALSGQLFLSPSNVSSTTGAPSAAVPAPTGNVTFTDSAKALGSAPLVYQGGLTGSYIATGFPSGKLAPGYHVLSATYPGDANYAATTSNTDTLGIGITTTSLALTASGSGSAVTINIAATVAAVVTPQTPALTGTVSFYKNTVSAATLISTQPLSGGTASINLAYPSTQTAIIAVYSGDANYYTSQSTTTTISGYVISVNPTSATMSAKGAVTVTVTATSYGGYTGIGSLSCSGLPANTFCPYNATQQFVFNGVDGAQPTSLTITALNAQGGSTPVHAGFLWLPAMLLAGLLAFGRKKLTVRGRQLLALAVLFCGMMALNGCSGGNDYSKYTSGTGTFNVTLVSNGTGANAYSPNLTTTAALSLQVQ